MNPFTIKPINKENWEEAVEISIHKDQEIFVPSVIESLAFAYIKPWDEAFDPYIICYENKIVGFFYLSYTPDSRDNYWIGGFQIDKKYQGKGYGILALLEILKFISETYTHCIVVSLTVEKNNEPARQLYEKVGFINQNKENQSGEIIYKLGLEPKHY